MTQNSADPTDMLLSRSHATNAPARRPVATVVNAVDLAKQPGAASAPVVLRRRWVADNDTVLVRPVSRQLARAGIHFGVPNTVGGKHVLLCNVDPCVLCLAHFKASPHLFAALYFIDDENLGVLEFAEQGGPGSLSAQLVPLLAQEDATDLVLEVTRSGRYYTVKRVAKLNPDDSETADDFGNEILRDLVAAGGGDFGPEALVATVTQWDNQTILAEAPSVERKLRVLRPDLDASKL